MYLVIASYLPSTNIYAQFIDVISLINVNNVPESTRDKPQSKVWKHNGYWWAVIPTSVSPTGTYLWRLDGDTWSKLIRLSTNTGVHADTKALNDITYILLVDDNSENAEFVRIQLSGSSYSLISGGPGSEITISLDSGVETATIDVDTQGRVWIASDEKIDANSTANIYVRWSESPYSSWTRVTLATGLNKDDICAITAFTTTGTPKVGVLWSNQNDDHFHFKYRLDSEDPATWHGPELAPPNQPGSFADDHINLAVSSDGTIYAAIKTSYSNSSDNTTIGLLERKTDGTSVTWNDYEVTKSAATRPIVLLDDTNHKIFVVYTSSYSSSSNIKYNWSSTSTISFTSASTLASGSFNNVTSTKQTFNNEVVILFSAGSKWSGIKSGTPLPVELAFFSGVLNGNKVELRWRTETEVNNYGFDIESTKDNLDWFAIGFVEGHGNSNSPKQYSFVDSDINLSGEYTYRLKQIDNDGTYEYSDVVSVEVGVPNNFYLSQNYPNPFNPETRIDFTLPEKQLVTIRVYNTLGEQVAELVNEEREAGSYSVIFDASRLPSGVYIYRLQTLSFTANRKMTLLK
jgi:hypothetical protein